MASRRLFLYLLDARKLRSVRSKRFFLDSSNEFNWKLPFTNVSYMLLSSSSAVCSEKKYHDPPSVRVKKIDTPDGVIEVKQKILQHRVTLEGPDGDIQIVTLEDAQRIAKRRNMKLHLVSERDPKNERPVYKLYTLADYNEAFRKVKSSSSSSSKEEKTTVINTKIAENDLEIKLKNILKWLKKEHTVKVTIAGNDSSAEKLYSTIVEAVKDVGRVPQKVIKGGEIRFEILLPKKPKAKKPSDESAPSTDTTKNPAET